MKVSHKITPVTIAIELSPEEVRTLMAVTPNIPSVYDLKAVIGGNTHICTRYRAMLIELGKAVGGRSPEEADEEMRRF